MDRRAGARGKDRRAGERAGGLLLNDVTGVRVCGRSDRRTRKHAIERTNEHSSNSKSHLTEFITHPTLKSDISL